MHLLLHFQVCCSMLFVESALYIKSCDQSSQVNKSFRDMTREEVVL